MWGDGLVGVDWEGVEEFMGEYEWSFGWVLEMALV